jgi:hypothetical protein
MKIIIDILITIILFPFACLAVGIVLAILLKFFNLIFEKVAEWIRNY